jgi:hypothetical protein
MENHRPVRTLRHFWKLLALLAIGMVVLVSALPWLLGTGPARRWIVARANQVLAPSRLEIDGLQLSWFGPTRINGLALRDAQGDRVIVAQRATWTRSLTNILTDRARYGVITLEDAAIEVDRLADGKIDLVETIEPILKKNPKNDLTIQFERARLQIQSSGLSEPVVSDQTGLTLEIPPAPRPLAWKLMMSRADKTKDRSAQAIQQGRAPIPVEKVGSADSESATLQIKGTFEQWNVPPGVPPGLTVSLAGQLWPFAIDTEALTTSGRFDGSIEIARKAGAWSSEGKATLVGLVASGPRLAGDHVRLDRVNGDWDLATTDGAWAVRRLEVSSPLGTVKAGETFPGAPWQSTRIEGTIDLAALARQLPHVVSLPEGISRDEEALGLTFQALYHPDADRLDVTRVSLAARYAALDASGSLTDLKGKKVADLKGRLAPDWREINRLLAQRIEPRAQVSGQPWTFRLQGPVGSVRQDGWLKTIEAELRIDLAAAEAYGMKLGPTPVVLRSHAGKLAIDPIDATLNSGRIHLEPELALDAEKGPAIRLGPTSTVSDAEVNDEVSHRVLSFVAPVLDRSTRVRGRVSVALEEAVFPLSKDAKWTTQVHGSVVFSDVEFVPGPLGNELLAAIGRTDVSGLKLDEPVALTIDDRRVYQEGLAIPIGKIARIELDGWVDFDRNLALTASLPLLSPMLANRPVLSSIVEGTRFEVPIRGTLTKPEIDKKAMNLALEELGKTLLFQGATQGLPNLLNRMTQPRDPGAPRPLTAEERRARRLERRAERRGLIPPPAARP